MSDKNANRKGIVKSNYINVNRVGNKPIIPIFILSTGRAGTNWLAWAASHTITSSVCVHEAPPMIKQLGLAYYHHLLNPADAATQCSLARESALAAVRRYYKKRYYIEVNQNMFSLHDPLKAAFPDALFIGLVRDGRAFVTSMINKGVYQRGGAYITPKEDTITAHKWSKWTLVQKLAWHWQEKIQCLQDAKLTIFRSEDLFGNRGFETWCQFWATWGIPHKTTPEYYKHLRSQRVNKTVHRNFPPYSNWPQKDKDDFWAICGPKMKELNYG